MNYKVGSRGSKLAMVQAEYVCEILRKTYPEHTFEIIVVKTKGDKIQNKPLDQIGGKGLFVREIEEKIRAGELHMGVHSMKDMPAFPAEGLVFTKTWKREDPRDVLILREKQSLLELPYGAVIGTGSKRRAFQLNALRPDLQIVNLRGNVDTRLRKMQEQKLDGIVLAAAGLKRLGMEKWITQYLEVEEMVSAPAQGALAIEVHQDNEKLIEMLDFLSDKGSSIEIQAEREFLQRMGGGCYTPVGAVCNKCGNGTYVMNAVFGDEAGKNICKVLVEGNNPEEMAKQAAHYIRRQMAGMVVLVGAGPGDPDLITKKGLEAIREADCIVYDRLIAPELLHEARPECEKIYVGKENRHHTLKQEEINELLVQKAMEYKQVIRLKGGDVYVFGRGGEEGIYLKEQGVPFSVIPGISSSIAGPAYAGIPVTHRGVSSGFHVMTAHNRKDELADLDFEALARSRETCIFMMGLSEIQEITTRLIEAGMPPHTKAAVISKATTKQQRTCCSDVKHIAKQVKTVELSSPAIIVIGDVVALRETLNVVGKTEKNGKKYLVAKIGKEMSRLTKILRNQGIFADEIQLGQIQTTSYGITKKKLEEFNWVVFTSQNGVSGFFENLYHAGLDARNLLGIKMAVIGKNTEKVLKQYGVCADLVPEAFHEDALIEKLSRELKSTDGVLYPSGGQEGSRFIEKIERICKVKEIQVYENISVQLPSGIENIREYEGVIFTCASSAERFMEWLTEEDDKWWKQEGRTFSIGPKTSGKLRHLGVRNIIQAEHFDYESLAGCINLDDNKRGELDERT